MHNSLHNFANFHSLLKISSNKSKISHDHINISDQAPQQGEKVIRPHFKPSLISFLCHQYKVDPKKPVTTENQTSINVNKSPHSQFKKRRTHRHPKESHPHPTAIPISKFSPSFSPNQIFQGSSLISFIFVLIYYTKKNSQKLV